MRFILQLQRYSKDLVATKEMSVIDAASATSYFNTLIFPTVFLCYDVVNRCLSSI